MFHAQRSLLCGGRSDNLNGALALSEITRVAIRHRSATSRLTKDEARRMAGELRQAAGAAAQRVNDAFVSRRAIMDRGMMGQVLDDLIPGDSTEIDEATLGMLFPPGEAAGVIDERTRTAALDSPETTAADFYSTGSRRSLRF
jgi:hypothetical protein